MGEIKYMPLGEYVVSLEPSGKTLRSAIDQEDWSSYVRNWEYFFDSRDGVKYQHIELIYDGVYPNFYFFTKKASDLGGCICTAAAVIDTSQGIRFMHENADQNEIEESEETSNFGLLAAAVDHICNYAYELGFDRGAVVKMIECHTSFVRVNNRGSKK